MDSMKNLECFYNESTTGHQKQTSSFSTLNNLSLKENTNNSKLDMKLDRSFNSKEDRASTKSLIKSYEEIIDKLSDEEKENNTGKPK